MQVQRSAPVYDVVVIGSGAGGGTAVKVLTDLGVKVLLLEAGPMLNPARDFKEHKTPYADRASRRGRCAPSPTSAAERLSASSAPPTAAGNCPASPTPSPTGSEFRWFRSRILGGRTNHYGRISLRFSDYDFKPHSTDGLGDRLADHLRRDRAVLRQGRSASSASRGTQGRHPQRARRHLPAAGAPRVHEMLVQEGLRRS